THIVWAAEDTWIPVDRAHRLQRAVPGSSLTVLPAAGHLVQLDAPAALTAELARWLGRQADAPRARTRRPGGASTCGRAGGAEGWSTAKAARTREPRGLAGPRSGVATERVPPGAAPRCAPTRTTDRARQVPRRSARAVRGQAPRPSCRSLRSYRAPRP